MRRLILLTFVTLDGVMQAPGGPEEDTSGGFKYGGWSVGYWDDFMGKVMEMQMAEPFDLLLGRKTYEIFAAYWPMQKMNRELTNSITPKSMWLQRHLANSTGIIPLASLVMLLKK